MSLKVIATEEYIRWHAKLTFKEQMQVDARIARIELFGHFGDAKNLGDGLAELRWKSGRRVYFANVENKIVLLLIGGLKNAQKKDIKSARLLLEKYRSN